MDLFLRWILSTPVLEPSFQPEAEVRPSHEFGETTPQVIPEWKDASNDRTSNSFNSDDPATSMEDFTATDEAFTPELSHILS